MSWGQGTVQCQFCNVNFVILQCTAGVFGRIQNFYSAAPNFMRKGVDFWWLQLAIGRIQIFLLVTPKKHRNFRRYSKILAYMPNSTGKTFQKAGKRMKFRRSRDFFAYMPKRLNCYGGYFCSWLYFS